MRFRYRQDYDVPTIHRCPCRSWNVWLDDKLIHHPWKLLILSTLSALLIYLIVLESAYLILCVFDKGACAKSWFFLKLLLLEDTSTKHENSERLSEQSQKESELIKKILSAVKENRRKNS